MRGQAGPGYIAGVRGTHGLRRYGSGILAGVSLVQGLLIVTPMPTYGLWLAHLIALELSLAGVVLGAAALMLAPRRRALFALALGATVVNALPCLGALQAARRDGHRLSLREYVVGAPPATVTVELDRMLDPGAADLRVDVYHAPGGGPHPFVVVLHGGSWRHGDKGMGRHVSRFLAGAGFTVVDVRYRLAPEHPFPAGIEDVKCVLGRLRQQAAALRLDPSRAVLLGRSAGGHMALLAAYAAGDRRIAPRCDVPDLPVQGVVGIYPVTDLVWGYEDPVRPDVVRGPQSLELYLGGPPSERPDVYRLASPLSWVDRPLPPTLLIHGAWDRMVRPGHSERLHHALAAAGHPSRMAVVPFAEHGFDLRPGGWGEQLARAEILRFLREVAEP